MAMCGLSERQLRFSPQLEALPRPPGCGAGSCGNQGPRHSSSGQLYLLIRARGLTEGGACGWGFCTCAISSGGLLSCPPPPGVPHVSSPRWEGSTDRQGREFGQSGVGWVLEHPRWAPPCTSGEPQPCPRPCPLELPVWCGNWQVNR